MTDHAFLEVKDLRVEYTSDKQIIHAVNGASFSLEKGETLGLVGETGAGKTTIAKSILRVLPDRAASIRSGKILYNGEDLLSASEERMRSIRGNEIAMIFQDPMTALNPTMSIGRQLMEPLQIHQGMGKQEAYEKACGHEINYKITDRRPGDIASSYANAERAKELLGWEAHETLETMCEDSWRFMQQNPNGL